jgi:hypothetical protein
MKNESQKLIKSINNGLANRGVREMIQEEYSILPTPISNPLVDGSEKLGKDNDQLMDEIEKFLRNRKR